MNERPEPEISGSEPPPSPTIPERVEEVLSGIFAEPMMRPLLIVILGHAAAFLIPVLLAALRDGSLPGLAALSILLVASGTAVVHDIERRKLRVLTGSIFVAWSMAGIGAYLGDRYGFF